MEPLVHSRHMPQNSRIGIQIQRPIRQRSKQTIRRLRASNKKMHRDTQLGLHPQLLDLDQRNRPDRSGRFPRSVRPNLIPVIESDSSYTKCSEVLQVILAVTSEQSHTWKPFTEFPPSDANYHPTDQ